MGFRLKGYSLRKILFFYKVKPFKELKCFICPLLFVIHDFILLMENDLSALLNT